jgi:hypothetical protein
VDGEDVHAKKMASVLPQPSVDLMALKVAQLQ